MEKHEEKLLRDAIQTAIKSEIECNRLKLWIIIENVILILLCAGVISWIGL